MDDGLGDRMKRYEAVAHYHLTRKVPVIIRVDGKSFHTFTEGFDKPFSMVFLNAMRNAAMEVAMDLQGFQVGYTQSDEASFFLADMNRVETDAWFGYDLQKIVSITAAKMSVCLSAHLPESVKGNPVFDARAFNIPESDVANYFLWRAKDWRRNSVQMLAHAHLPSSGIHGKKNRELLVVLKDSGHDWDKLDACLKNGTFFMKDILDGSIKSTTSIEPNYDDINQIVPVFSS